MIFLLLSILFSTLIQVIFRFFGKLGVDNQIAITMNYLVCVLVGNSLAESNYFAHIREGTANWLTHSLLLGILFIIVFVAMARCAQVLSISISTVAAKMGVLFPVLFGWLFLKEQMNLFLATGILCSLLSIATIVKIRKGKLSEVSRHSLLPLLVFVGSGIIDTNLKILENTHFETVDPHFVVTSIFLGAFLAGMIEFSRRMYRNRSLFSAKNLIAGVVLGVPNYFSIYFLMKALHQEGFSTVYVLPLNNIGIVLLSVLVSVVVFRELLTKRLAAGIALAILAIGLIGIS
ncbi:MAG: hypothetical protein H6606_08525 [Flavobacteriales bacterium]|nr:hypothetical protein [Flavobacteriales bacterium]